MSDFHGRVMNIQCNMSASICRPAEDTALAYKYGHRDACHAAEEIANEADAAIAAKDSEIENLRYELASEKTYVQQVQAALNRWLPMVDEDSLGKDAADVAANDAYFLCGLVDFSGREFGKEIVQRKDAEIARLREALTDMLSGWAYIRQTHGDLYGVGWDRAENKASAALAGGGE